eukprot:TRINITY_DN22461_c0_g1_i1.p1 TRINITY_DN22461_c0_g1~~TRINITY_DN22461_c0_g1_i1.p1  ORF type:complete len:598 (+),score=239.55 TRINITY_DN22461_c0_g1_i1:131-1924(+)
MASYFLQDPPRLGNQYEEDTALVEGLHRLVPADVLKGFESDLSRFGERAATDVLDMGRSANRTVNEPHLVQHNGWGHRVDDIVISEAWKALHGVAAEEGLIALGYERRSGKYSRLHQFSKLFMYGPSSAIYTCPLAMTDGAAKLIEELLRDRASLSPSMAQRLQEHYAHLTSRSPSEFWTSGQWMTERTGGSDVGNTETFAVKDPNSSDPDRYLLTGYKFFTSATTSPMAFTLARIKDANGNAVKGSRGLALFLVNTRNIDGKLNNIVIHRLKTKLGTRAVPTAELELVNTVAYLASPPGQGVRKISSLFNLTRIYNATSSVGGMRRMIALVRDYAHRRKVFGRPLSEQPLHLATVANMEVTYRGALQMVLQLLLLLGESEVEPNTRADHLLRVLTPLAKLHLGKIGLATISEGLECFGGAGYVEDTGLPVFLRDAQVETIWEGTTNVLSLDILRVLARSPASFDEYFRTVAAQVAKAPASLSDVAAEITAAAADLRRQLEKVASQDAATTEAGARALAFSLSSTYIASLLVEHAVWSKRPVDEAIARRWTRLHPLVEVRSADWARQDAAIALDLDPSGRARGSGDVAPNGKPRARY